MSRSLGEETTGLCERVARENKHTHAQTLLSFIRDPRHQAFKVLLSYTWE